MLIGKRLRLRAIEKEDLPRFVAWVNDPEVARHLVLHTPMSLPQEEKWYERILQQHTAEQPLVIERDAPQGWTPIGNIGFLAIDWVNRSTELGIFIGEKTSWNQGYGREAIHCYEHAGFILEGRLRQAKFEEGHYIDLLLMSVLRSEWQNRQNS